MSFRELYEKNKFRKYREIEKVENDVVLKARVKNFIDRYKKVLIIALCIISILIIVAFHSKLNVLVLTFFMLALILLLSVYFNTFTIICKNNKMVIKMNMQEIEIEYSKLKNVYIENKKTRIFIKKRDNFLLLVLYKAPNGNISNIYLPTLFLSKKETNKFLKTFKVKEEKSDNIVKAQKYEMKRLLIKIGLFVLVWLGIILTMASVFVK